MSLSTDLARLFDRFATYLQLDGANTFKTNAYTKAVRLLKEDQIDLQKHIDEGTLTSIDGIGKGIAEKIEEYAETGKLTELEELQSKFPPGLIEMTAIPGFGAKKTATVYEKLDIESIDELAEACNDGRIADLKGFGKKTAEKVLAGIEQLKKHSGRHRLDTAWASAKPYLKVLEGLKEVQRVELAGSIRRFKETVKDLDFVCATEDPKAVMKAFTEFEEVDRVTGSGGTKASVVLKSGIQADLRCVTEEQFPFTLQHFTGSKEHNTKLRALAKEKGLKSNEYGLFKEGSDNSIKAKSEADVYKALGLKFIEPELREDRGEIEKAKSNKLPKLIEEKDLRGVLHMHTHYSDGEPRVEDYAHWASENNIEWMGITDHSQTAAYAGGLKPADIKKQWKEIDDVNKEYNKKKVGVLKGIESDILKDGSLDYVEDILKGFDFIVASVHNQFTLSEDDQTKRIIAAVENPYTSVLGHMTGRLLLKREGYQVRQKEVIKAAGESGTIIEINCNPHRLDMDWRLVEYALECGVVVCLSPDAHHMSGLGDLFYGVGIARKGWVTKDVCANTWSADDFLKYVHKKRGS